MLALSIMSLGITAQAQRRAYRMTDQQVGELIRRVETSADRFRATLDNSLDRSRYDGTRAEDNINAFVQNFETTTDQLRERFNRRASVAADVESVLRQAASIDTFIRNNNNTVPRRAQSDWALVRTDLDALARAYGVTWNWSQQTTPGYGSQPQYGGGNRQVGQLIRRIETNTATFRTSLANSLGNSRVAGTRREDRINDLVRDFEAATVQLRNSFRNRTTAAVDVQNVLDRAVPIDNFMRRQNLTGRAESDWALVRTDLDALASAYNVSANWNSNTNPLPGGGSVYTASGLTGTYRLDPTRSDNARDVADRVTRNLPAGERQRVYDRVLARLDSPEMLAIERRGMAVTIASSRAPQTTFEADGRERDEQLPNGRASRVSARLTGEQLVVRSTGFRENDFSVTFAPIEGGRRLRVTREIWSERLGANPVVVQNIYDRTADVAQFNVYTGTQVYSGGNTSQTGSGDFIMNNGQTLVAVLDTDLTTRASQVGDRFTMTVREPAQYEGAVIEGRVATVNRSGRVQGRSEISLDFDTIRLRNGQSYRFAGFIESARTTNGDVVRVDNEGSVQDNDSRGNTTAQRAAIGTAVGAIIGAIAGGGKGAVIGAVVGAAGGAGSVYVQGRDELELLRGTEVSIRASAPR
jgi:hypothetical protein